MENNNETTSNREIPICPKCGTSMVENHLDSSFSLDGSVALDGYKCPKCNQQGDSKEHN